ncbi:hypothetical protein SO802_021918 [Lithocarpus litseifolius]|uniref:Uncharacterized protein n=1 Tax=Lithocarpus litseifolius TaxID=425828 RepID=A0AAW2CIK4_9ROSI
MPKVIETLKIRLSDRTTYPEIEPDNGELVKEHLWGLNFLPCAYAVAQKLIEKEEQKWEILIKFWVENLARVATLCQGNNHAQQLRKGTSEENEAFCSSNLVDLALSKNQGIDGIPRQKRLRSLFKVNMSIMHKDDVYLQKKFKHRS